MITKKKSLKIFFLLFCYVIYVTGQPIKKTLLKNNLIQCSGLLGQVATCQCTNEIQNHEQSIRTVEQPYNLFALKKSKTMKCLAEKCSTDHDQKKLNQYKISLPMPIYISTTNSCIILNNANVPIKVIRILDANKTSRFGVPRSPKSELEDQSLWEIPINLETKPYQIEITANNHVYKSYITSIEQGYGNELGLIQFKRDKIKQGTLLKTLILCLIQIEEFNRYIHQHKLPLYKISSLPTSQ